MAITQYNDHFELWHRLLIAVIVVTWFTTAVSACVLPSVEDRMSESDVVFAARIGEHFHANPEDMGGLSGHYLPLIGHAYETQHIWKGRPGRYGDVHVYSFDICMGTASGSCGPEFKAGETYLMFAKLEEKGLIATHCYSRALEKSLSDRLQLGKPEETFGVTLPEITPDLLIARLQDDDLDMTYEAARVLKRLGRGDDLVAHIVQNEWLCDAQSHQFRKLMGFLDVLEHEAASIIGQFEHFWTCGGAKERGSWISTLKNVVQGWELFELTKRGLNDEDYWVRHWAALSASKIEGPARDEIRQYMLEMMHSNVAGIRLSGAEGFNGFYDLTAEEIETVCTFQLSGLDILDRRRASSACNTVVFDNRESAQQTEIGKQVLNSVELWER